MFLYVPCTCSWCVIIIIIIIWWNSNWAAAAQAVNARAAVASSAYIALGYLQSQAAIATGLLCPKIAPGAILEGLKFKNFLGGHAPTPP